ncbi:hypothetical protein GCM10010218_41620 [Streptomyces mashuensis]|uniref:Uncharacterized protein n=1 Tax=Streptomyces mashuensis TaxID=33904 RepID=A0A919EEB9_9ACTN|nr:hypothetical protein [Streptomyces mashuensis]GHF55747.1 hypothetical protein GCM10010218_41620 [Streptomyces mashuensis]
MNAPIARHQGPPWPALSALAVSTATLLVEEALAAVVLWVWGLTRPGTPGDGDEGGAAFVLFGLPLIVGAAAVVALVVTLVLVLPTVALAARAAKRYGRPGAWWWLPATAAAVSALTVGAAGTAVALLGGGAAAPLAYAAWWLVVLVLVLPAGLLVRRDVRRTARGLAPASLARTVLLRGCGGLLAFVVTLLLSAVAAESLLG